MKQVLIRSGKAVVEDVPAPRLEPGTVLVRTDHSCISVGTEMSGVRSTGTPLWKRALQQPENVKKVIQMAATQGVGYTKNAVRGQLAAGNPTGYSAAGVVIEAAPDVVDIHAGDRVACAGAQCAHHAEIICVPRNLTVHVPDTLSFKEAGAVTLGAIALQGIRRARPTLGERFVVIGLGILGQLTVQMLRANGCRVIGTDLNRDRIRSALEAGMEVGINPEDADPVEQVSRLTSGIGADGAIITAATPSDEVVSAAFQMCRRKGRVVLVGDVGLHLNRADFYQKELDFFISTSYGPGRYDSLYEEKGIDYPIAYVRWTENRNMAEYLQLLADGKVDVNRLISGVYPIDKAPDAYEELKAEGASRLMVMLSYPEHTADSVPERVIPNPSAKAAKPGKIRVAVAGAGGFAKGMHLPNLQKLSGDYHIRAIMSRTGHNAAATAKRFEAEYSTTDFDEILNDPETDAVFITTRHNLHASMALEALKAGKHVLVEKPPAVNANELKSIAAFYEEHPDGPVLLTGFNRRFSPYLVRIKDAVKDRSGPMILNYRMNAGYIPRDHWVHTEEGGGRNIGEACHIYDLFTFLTGEKVVSVDAKSIDPRTDYYGRNDNFVVVLSFAEGSVATLTYTALGSSKYPKEHLEAYVDGKVIELRDYSRLTFHGSGGKDLSTKTPDKGQKEEIAAFARCISEGGPWPIELWEQIQATEIALRVERQITGQD